MNIYNAYQWDQNKTVPVPSQLTVHFALRGAVEAAVVPAESDGAGGYVAQIPNALLQDGSDILGWYYVDAQTTEAFKVSVTRRTKPADYIYTPQEVITYESILDVYQQLLEKSFVPGPKGDKGDQGPAGPAGVDGKDGADGKDGVDGKDGYTPVRGTDYWTAADIAAIHSYIDQELGVIENGAY